MKHLQAITLIKPHVRFYSSTLEAVGCQPSVFSGGLECAPLPVRLRMCGGLFFGAGTTFSSRSIVYLLLHVPDVCRGSRVSMGGGQEIDGER